VEAAAKAVREALGAAPVDLTAQTIGGRRKRLLVADMDSTIVTTETLDELAAKAGKKDQTAAITERAMLGEIGFPEALRERVAMLAGLDEQALAETLAAVELTPGAETLVRTMTRDGAHTVLVSGGAGYFAERVAKMTGFHDFRGNHFETADGRLTGRVIEPILDKDAKYRTLTEFAQQRQIPLAETLAIGDGANDVPMIKAAGLGVAYQGKPVAKSAANAVIDHTDLRAALFMQGYRSGEFTSS
jgi:phosphoserine phosphatase